MSAPQNIYDDPEFFAGYSQDPRAILARTDATTPVVTVAAASPRGPGSRSRPARRRPPAGRG